MKLLKMTSATIAALSIFTLPVVAYNRDIWGGHDAADSRNEESHDKNGNFIVDETLTEKAKNTPAQGTGPKTASLSVDSNGGVVRITCNVEKEQKKQDITWIATSVSGVASINDAVKIRL